MDGKCCACKNKAENKEPLWLFSGVTYIGGNGREWIAIDRDAVLDRQAFYVQKMKNGGAMRKVISDETA